ncbi:MAG: hypothetical protein ABIP85_17485 [Chthoniobacteraceae bacterium]
MAKTEIWIHDSSGYQQLYWVDRRPTTIVGWFATPRMMNTQIGLGSDERPDIHFTYPSNGDFHFSLKTKSKDGQTNHIKRVYSDRIEQIAITSTIRAKIVSPRGEDPNCFGFLVPRFRPPAIKDFCTQSRQFGFATTGFNIVNGEVIASALCRLPKCSKPPQSALVIEATRLGTGAINVGANLAGKDAALAWPETKHVTSRLDESALPRIELYAVFTPVQ